MARLSQHQIDWAAPGLRLTAAEVGVTLPVAYSEAAAADGPAREPTFGVTCLGAGVVVHARPDTDKLLPIVLGYEGGATPMRPRILARRGTSGRRRCDGRSYQRGDPRRPHAAHRPRDPVVEAHGDRPRSSNVEAVWLRLLGLSATWVWQRAARLAAASPSSVLDMADPATSLGLGKSLRRSLHGRPADSPQRGPWKYAAAMRFRNHSPRVGL